MSRDRGSATVWAALVTTVLGAVFGGVLMLGQAVVARHRAAAAADLASLAAATAWAHGPEVACGAAARVARAQGATLAGCRLRGEVVDVEARVPMGPFAPSATARAGPPLRPVTARAGPPLTPQALADRPGVMWARLGGIPSTRGGGGVPGGFGWLSLPNGPAGPAQPASVAPPAGPARVAPAARRARGGRPVGGLPSGGG
ncbi:Rv3654c family TadE-like protein [Streptomyces sp. NPDC058279]|uniref:Rv3654c family TadE-like protein n=1 Tax=Streptomyces sp. NPDC058279 TaxID=3346418 RepID=UPI0036EA053B